MMKEEIDGILPENVVDLGRSCRLYDDDVPAMKTVCQILPNMEYGDAISNYALLIDRLLRASGHRAQLYAQYVHPSFRRVCQPLGRASGHLGDEEVAWIYHYSTSSPATQLLHHAAGPVSLIYHNVTPAIYVAQLGGAYAARAFQGRKELADFAGVPCAVAADSTFNARDLADFGYRDVRVIPVAIDFDKFDRDGNPRLVRALREGKTVNFVTVGRIAPHKKVEDVIKVFYYYQNYINPRSRLYIVGDGEEYTPYVHQLLHLCEDLGIPNIHFTGKVRFRDLLAYYRASDIYLCMSEHEGFCVPLLEAMYLGIPVIANATPAIVETMGEGGVLVNEKRADVIAEMADLLMRDPRLRTRVINCQKDRALDFQVDRLANDITRLLAEAQARFERRKRGEDDTSPQGAAAAAISAAM